MSKKIIGIIIAIVLCIAAVAAAVVVNNPSMANLEGKTVILHSNDVHGAVESYACIAALAKEYESRGAEVILVDAGDFSQGTTYVSSSKGESAVELMNAAGYDIAVPGNHEFDYGYAKLKENIGKAEFRTLCADVFENGKTIFDANYTYETKSGIKIGFFGLATPESQTKANPALIKGLKFLAGEKMYECANEQAKALADDDIVICISHLGVDKSSEPNCSGDIFANTEGIDFIIDGHSHTVMTEGKDNAPIQSTGLGFENIGVIVIDNETKKIEKNFLEEVKEKSPRDEAVSAAAAEIVEKIKAEYDVVFAKSEVELNGDKAPNGNRDGETNLGDLVADSMVWTVLKNKGSITVGSDKVVAITNGGGIREWIHRGDITKNNVNTVLPFGNTVAVVYVTGEELLEALEASTYCTPEALGGFPQVSGITFSVDTSKEYAANEETYPDSTYYGPASINRVTVDSVNGKDFDKEATYAVITNDFCAAGGDTYYAFASAKSQFDTGITLDEALMSYITEELSGVIGADYARPEGRITVK